MNILNSYLITDKSLLRNNIKQILYEISKKSEKSSLIPVLKDNAYGLGLEEIAYVVSEFDEIKSIACAHVSEGIRLKNAGINKNIIILGNPASSLIDDALKHNLILTLAREGIVEDIISAASRTDTKSVFLNIEIDSGLHRTGFTPGKELEDLIISLKNAKNNNISLNISGVYSHFSDPSNRDLCNKEYNAFKKGISQLQESNIPVSFLHISSSASFENSPEFSMDAVRIGRRLYMDAPGITDGNIKEIASWRAFITGIYHRKKGSPIGYGQKTILKKDSDLAIISVGYGDGLNTQLVDIHAPVLVRGKKCPLLVCFMDQSIVDVTDCAVSVGDEVTLFGNDGNGAFLSSQELALMIGDNEGCGLYSEISSRVERLYIE